MCGGFVLEIIGKKVSGIHLSVPHEAFSQAFCPVTSADTLFRERMHDGRPCSDDGIGAYDDAWANKDISSDPDIIFEHDGIFDERHVNLLIVVAACAEVGILADGASFSDGDGSQAVENCVVSDGAVGSDGQIPGVTDAGGGADTGGGVDGRSEEFEEDAAEGVPVVKRETKEPLGDNFPRQLFEAQGWR